ncbi:MULTISPECIES: DUF2196 domain-containing protein [unclassified Exiguobacterium]|uniref:DUF2196 domain-containing protein n=1 Tax=unclassified Exiguobacterium TaxID=2644629 RepID=UPI001BE82B0A|nr:MULTISPECIES: DUF2196 domain-containing protein [unclassified Exiguobacterium]
MSTDVTMKNNFRPGMMVDIETDSDKKKGTVTRGIIAKVLSKGNQPSGVKVQLTTGEVGRVYEIPSRDEVRREHFRFYNTFFFLKKIYSVWVKKEKRYYTLNYPSAHGDENTAFLFVEKEEGEQFMKMMNLHPTEYMVKEISRRKPIHENFKTLEVDVFRIDLDRKVSVEKLIELESYFKNMR